MALTVSLLLTLCSGCKKYLDVKPDKQLATPSDLSDLLAILDAETMNVDYPSTGDMASDDYFLTDATWSALPSFDARNDYVWDANAANDQDWQYMYSEIENANVVLDGLNTLADNTAGLADYNNVKGMALFFRGYALSQLANVFTLPYDGANSNTLPGLPLRLTSDITSKITRSSMAATYGQIVADLRQAVSLLPVQPLVKSRPSKPAAYGALARTYLVMGDYENSFLYSDSCLQLYHTLINYNTLNPTAAIPFQRFNAEVIFHTTSSGRGSALSTSRARVDTSLYKSYNTNDLRKQVYFNAATGGYYSFKGDYSGANSSLLFNGLATNELLLIRAESNARLGKGAEAVNDLNLLLDNRWKLGTYIPASTSLPTDSALSLVLKERRKELAFKGGIRWSDIRRLNKDDRFFIIPERTLARKQYTLVRGDKRYAFLVPQSVVQLSGIVQNGR